MTGIRTVANFSVTVGPDAAGGTHTVPGSLMTFFLFFLLRAFLLPAGGFVALDVELDVKVVEVGASVRSVPCFADSSSAGGSEAPERTGRLSRLLAESGTGCLATGLQAPARSVDELGRTVRAVLHTGRLEEEDGEVSFVSS